MIELETLRERWIAERPIYGALCERVKEIVAAEARQRGVFCSVQARPKEVSSLLKKALRKQYDNPYDEIHDKAGVRAVCTYHDSLPRLEEIVRESFSVHDYENKSFGLDYDKLGYLGIHFEVSLQEEKLKTNDPHKGLICEIQLHTRAQNLWPMFPTSSPISPPRSRPQR